MLYRFTGALFCFALAALSAPTALAVEDAAPAWLQQAASVSVPTYKKDVPAVVLVDEANVTIGADGLVTITSNYAVRILTREGRGYAAASEAYETDSGKVREMRAWLIRPGVGKVKSYAKDDVLDVAAALNDVYNETRIKQINASDEADAGAVFGYQSVTEYRSFFNQTVWSFQGRIPVLSSRYTMTLPASWRATSVTFNHAKVEPAVTGTTYAWELRDLPPIESEPSSPSITTLAPRIAVSYAPATGAASALNRSFESWSEVSRWYTELSDPQVTLDDAIAAKARELTSTAKTELERIRAISRYVQKLQYISIQIGVGRFRPHSATEVFAKAYGDCKDKANLMRAMLKAVKIEAYPVLIYSGDSTYVREEWTSPGQFNHCIVAIKVSDETQAQTIVKHPTLGRLLIFDATDPQTPLGDLPDHEQGSLALIAAGSDGALMRMPVTPPEANQLERQVEAVLSPDGSLVGSIQERSTGQSAADQRRAFSYLSRPQYIKMIEAWITQGATGALVSKVEPVDQSADGRFALDVAFSAPSYGQLMQSRLLVFKPAIVSRRESLFLTEAVRKHPVVLESTAYTETVHVKLPDGFDVDEMPDPLKLDTAFGNYNASYDVKDGQLVFKRKLILRASTIPAEQYQSVRTFFERIRAVEQSPVVLAKK
jgi:Domain of Unknown Function with PDB structure (DUF3857)/Transglutaminase-like superfamily